MFQAAGTQVLVLGLDGAGKTSLLSCWATGSPEADVKPTQGFNAVSINRDDLHVDFLESESAAGCESTRFNSEMFDTASIICPVSPSLSVSLALQGEVLSADRLSQTS